MPWPVASFGPYVDTLHISFTKTTPYHKKELVINNIKVNIEEEGSRRDSGRNLR